MNIEKGIFKAISAIFTLSLLVVSGCATTPQPTTTDEMGITIKAPSIAEHGEVVPIAVKLSSPLEDGDVLKIFSDGEPAAVISTHNYPIKVAVTRVRMQLGEALIEVHRKNGEIEQSERSIQINTPAKIPAMPRSGVIPTSVETKALAKGNKIKMLFANDMAISGHIKKISVYPTSDSSIVATLTPRVSQNAYFAFEGTKPMGDVKVETSLK